MSKLLSALLVMALLALYGCGESAVETGTMPVPPQGGVAVNKALPEAVVQGKAESAAPEQKGSPSQPALEPINEVNVKAFRYGFDPDPIILKKGEKTVLHVTSTDVEHGMVIPEFGVDERLPAGKTVDIPIVPQRQGTFEYACSVFCGSGHAKMKGTIIVE